MVCPLSITGVWLDEFQKFAAFDYSIVVLEGSGEKKKKLLREFDGDGLQVVVVNYESAWRLEAELYAWKPDIHLRTGMGREARRQGYGYLRT